MTANTAGHGRRLMTGLLLLLATVACSRLFGIKFTAESSSPLEPACVDAALAGRENLRRTEHRVGWTGWEFEGPAGRTRVDLLDDDTVHVSWTRNNQPFPAADCVRMRPWLEDLYAQVRGTCAGLPTHPREIELPCAE